MAGGAAAAAGMWLGGVLKQTLGLSGLVAISAAITMASAVFFLIVIWRRFDTHHKAPALE